MCGEQSSSGRSEHCSRDLETLFRTCFYRNYRTVLRGGAMEPLYVPAGTNCGEHLLQYREYFFASALHETAHWCIAGEERRGKVDFGYWYFEDGRTRIQQRAFETAEIKPQALEWIFSVAAGASFQVSRDNLSVERGVPDPGDHRDAGGGRASDTMAFADAVYRQVLSYCVLGLPERAAQFAEALTGFYGTENPLEDTRYHRQYLG